MQAPAAEAQDTEAAVEEVAAAEAPGHETPVEEPPVEEPPIEEPPKEEPPKEEPPVKEAQAEAVPVPEESGQAKAFPTHPHWLLSLYTPAEADTVDWGRGNYAVLARGGRVDSPAGTGELKKQLQMVAEGSVVYAAGAPCGTAPDVAPDGFAHPVFRAGFALSIRLPEVSG